MAWKTRLFASHEAWVAAGHPVGGVMPVPEPDRERRGIAWPDRYKTAAAYYVALPTGQLWCPWQKAYNPAQQYHGDGWNVSGPPDRLTATPSIAVNGYHGYLRDGEITDDVEGRIFPRRPDHGTLERPLPVARPHVSPSADSADAGSGHRGRALLRLCRPGAKSNA